MNGDLYDEEIHSLRVDIPIFWHNKEPIKRNNKIKGLHDFHSFILKHQKWSYSKLFQDFFVDLISSRKEIGGFLRAGLLKVKNLKNLSH
ncbi:hypothetical protein N9C22_04560 [Paracoccaceae bacterium]|nr:hypothetical protein [Paracoccaceae bacterium]